MMQSTITVAFCVVMLFTAPALADDFAPPPWDRNDPFAVEASWEFLTSSFYQQPDGLPTDAVGSGVVMIMTANDDWVPDEFWFNDCDGDCSPAGGSMTFTFPTVVENRPLKLIRIQVTHSPITDPANLPTFWFGMASDATGMFPAEVGSIWEGDPIAVDPMHTLLQASITPSPDWEVIGLGLPGFVWFDHIIVETYSVPTPAAWVGALVLSGGLMVRRR